MLWAFFMSMRLWKKVVIGRHRMPGGIPRGLPPGRSRTRAGRAVSQAGGGAEQVRAELGDAVVVVADQDVAGARPALRGQLPELGEVVDHGDQVRGRRPAAVAAGDLVHPPAAVRGADPQCPVDAQRLRTQGAPVQEDVLAGVRAEALAEQHDPRAAAPAGRGAAARIRSHSSRFCSRASLTLPSDSGDGPLRVLQRHGRDVAPGQVLRRAAVAT